MTKVLTEGYVRYLVDYVFAQRVMDVPRPVLDAAMRLEEELYPKESKPGTYVVLSLGRDDIPNCYDVGALTESDLEDIADAMWSSNLAEAKADALAYEIEKNYPDVNCERDEEEWIEE